jgi:hypothetical protein
MGRRGAIDLAKTSLRFCRRSRVERLVGSTNRLGIKLVPALVLMSAALACRPRTSGDDVEQVNGARDASSPRDISLSADAPGTADAASITRDAGAVTADVADLAEAGWLAAYCELMKPCCAAEGLPTDGKQCAEFFDGLGPEPEIDLLVEKACIAEQQALAAKGKFCEDGRFDSELCQRAWRRKGTKTPGEACMEESECAQGPEGVARCYPEELTSGTAPMRCQIQARGIEGSKPCVATALGRAEQVPFTPMPFPLKGYVCYLADGLRCDGGACVRVKRAGEPCATLDDCMKGTFCNGLTKMCAPRKPLGADCSAGLLGDKECDDGGWCPPNVQTCVAQVGYGALCQGGAECRSGMCKVDRCDLSLEVAFGLEPVCGRPR